MWSDVEGLVAAVMVFVIGTFSVDLAIAALIRAVGLSGGGEGE